MAQQRQKRRTHRRPDESGVPKSMVIQTSTGTSGRSLGQLTKDTRAMMAPHTAAKLRERKSNKLRDYTAMAGPLGVSHLLLFNQSASGPTLRIARTPNGPTLFFRISRYSLCKDVAKAVRNPRGASTTDFAQPPLVVLNNFASSAQARKRRRDDGDGSVDNGGADGETSDKKRHPEEELMRTTFQNMFPAVSTATADVRQMRRVVLFHRDENRPGAPIEMRHYAVTTRDADVDRRVRRLTTSGNANARHATDHTDSRLARRTKKELPNLGHLDTIEDYILDPAALTDLSASESEYEEDAKVDIPAARAATAARRGRVSATDASATTVAGDEGGSKKSVKLIELGPRISLELYKVTAGLSTGAVLYHRDITLTQADQAAQDRQAVSRRQEKAGRVAAQRENIDMKKRKAEEAGGSRSKRAKLRARAKDAEDGEDEDEDDEAAQDGGKPGKKRVSFADESDQSASDPEDGDASEDADEDGDAVPFSGADLAGMTEQELDEELAAGRLADSDSDSAS